MMHLLAVLASGKTWLPTDCLIACRLLQRPAWVVGSSRFPAPEEILSVPSPPVQYQAAPEQVTWA